VMTNNTHTHQHTVCTCTLFVFLRFCSNMCTYILPMQKTTKACIYVFQLLPHSFIVPHSPPPLSTIDIFCLITRNRAAVCSPPLGLLFERSLIACTTHTPHTHTHTHTHMLQRTLHAMEKVSKI
jgi:hypothetical protein